MDIAAITSIWVERIQPRLVTRPTGCMEWQGATTKGYGCIRVKVDGKWKTLVAHRLAYEASKGRALGRLQACHSCDNPICCNPRHIFGGTAKMNVKDAIAKGRFLNGSQRFGQGSRHLGSRLNEQQVVEIRRQAKEIGVPSSIHVARKFGVSATTINRIVNRQAWKHVP